MRNLLFLLLLLAGGCQNSVRLVIPDAQVISYPLENQQFVVLVVEDNGVNEATAKKEAMQKAAQVTIDNGYRYFSILSEKIVEVTKMSQPQGSQVPQNLYQEKIVQKGMGRQSLEQDQGVSTGTYPAYRLEIECFADKPAMKKSYDAKQVLNS